MLNVFGIQRLEDGGEKNSHRDVEERDFMAGVIVTGWLRSKYEFTSRMVNVKVI